MSKSSAKGSESPLRDRMKDVEQQLEKRIRERERLASEMAALTDPARQAFLNSLGNQAQLTDGAKRMRTFLQERKPAPLAKPAGGFDPLPASPKTTIFRASIDLRVRRCSISGLTSCGKIADDESKHWFVDGKSGEMQGNSVAVQRSKLRVHARMWLLSKLAPKRFA